MHLLIIQLLYDQYIITYTSNDFFITYTLSILGYTCCSICHFPITNSNWATVASWIRNEKLLLLVNVC